jgi:type VI secretion system protein ImpF
MATSSRIDPDQPLVVSVLDRLLDETTASAVEAQKPRGQYLADLRTALRRDLEELLNTHQSWVAPPPDLSELSLSLIDYGLPHFLGLQVASDAAREKFRAEVEALLRRFEPRFARVSVVLLENTENLERTLRFRIEALVHAEPDLEPVSFDSMLEPVHRRFAVTAAARE